MTAKHVVIVGGGISGLTAAYRLMQLHQSGQQDLVCTIVEQDSRFGGKIHTLQTEDYLLELGPDSIYTRKQGGVELIHELGLDSDVVPVTSGGGTFIWNRGRLTPLPGGFGMGVPSDLTSFSKTDLISKDGKRKALEDIVSLGDPLQGDVSLGEFLKDRLGDELVETISSPLLAGIHAGDLDRMSLDATMPSLRRLFAEHGSLIVGAMEMMKKVPAQTGSPKPMFINLKNGLGQLVDHLVSVVGEFAELRTSTTVRQVAPSGTGKYDITIESEGDLQHLVADAVILVTPAGTTAELLEGCGVDTSALKSIRYASTATISFGFDQDPGLSDFNSSGYLVPRNQGTEVTACTVVSKKWSHASKHGKPLLRCYVGHDGSDAIVDLEDGTLIREVEQHLKLTLGITATPDFTEIKRWYHAMPQYDVGHLERVKEIENALQKAPGVTIAGAAYYGAGIPDCIRSASRAVEQVGEYFAATVDHVRS